MFPRRTSRQSKNFTAKRRMRTAFFVSVGVVSLALVVYCASAISSMESFQITAVSVDGVETDGEADALRASALESLQGAYLGIFSRANTLVYPKKTIGARITEEHPWVGAVSVSREGAHTIKLAVTEKESSALVCLTFPDFNGNDLSLEDPGSCYFADEAGFIFRKAPSFSGNVYRRYYMPDLGADASTTDAVVGTIATSSISFEALQKFYQSISEQGILVDAILVKPEGEYELYARNPAEDTTSASTVVVYFNDSSPLDEQATNLVSFLRHATDQARAKKQSVRYDSIDIRYGSNVFYRESK
jgi:hypothetical protein